ncbi:glutaredoxin-1 isoform X2 [Phocoena sinus]|uniref:glutaredoxin-1 isoform X2 n=1 Tax=Phocoena sinus TaxID=42100 RepID=UPI0013C51E2F|nr:glutaredoxin-1 isoform X2 [Phocoena sinus]
MAQAFVNSKIQPGKVVVFIKPTCPYSRRAQELLSHLPFKQGLLEFVDITARSDTNEIQDYLQQLTGARTCKAWEAVLPASPVRNQPSGAERGKTRYPHCFQGPCCELRTLVSGRRERAVVLGEDLLAPDHSGRLEPWNTPYLAAGREPECDSR